MSHQKQPDWNKPSAVPGSVRPVYGAKYPPLVASLSTTGGSNNAQPASSTGATGLQQDQLYSFKRFEQDTSDVWQADADDGKCTKTLQHNRPPVIRGGSGGGQPPASNLIHSAAARDSAAQVLALHAAGGYNYPQREQGSVPKLTSSSAHRKGREQALQRLATQKEPLPVPGAVGAAAGGPMYPRLPELSIAPSSSKSSSNLLNNNHLNTDNNNVNVRAPYEQNAEQVRFARLEAALSDDRADLDLNEIRKLCWKGIPHKLRPKAWRLLLNYVPLNTERRSEMLQRKRHEYFQHVEQYFHTRFDDQHQEMFRQIHIDIPRMCPLIPLFQQQAVQEMFERILYIWAIRHPASGYVQGINDLVTPFFVVFLSEIVTDDTEVGTCDVTSLPLPKLQMVEADSFWCVTQVLDTIQDNYTFAQPGIQTKVQRLSHLTSRVDNNLHTHLMKHQVDYLQFSFRWMNNLLMREMPLRCTIRLWDTYMSEPNGFSEFHVYVCAAFLRVWSKNIQQHRDFQGTMLLLQNLPTQSWSDQQVCEMTADAFSLKCLFADAKNHLVLH